MDMSEISDEMLTAYLDGEIDTETSERITQAIEHDPELASRLRRLQIPMPAIRETFDKVAASAPMSDLEDLINAENEITSGSRLHPGRLAFWGLAAVASILLALGMGMLVGRSVLPSDSDRDWRVAVAEYQALYVEDTLRFVDEDLEERSQGVERVTAELGIDVPHETLEGVDGLAFKRAQILRWQDRPLGQFAFLDDKGEPFAFCATATDDADQPIETTWLKDLAVSSWINGGTAFMVIGGTDPSFNATIAERLSGQL